MHEIIQSGKAVAIIEARMTSSRLPGKVLLESCGKPLLQHMIERVRRSCCIDDIVVATTINSADDSIVNMCKRIGCSYFRGSENNVLLRVLEAAKKYDADIIVEMTGDCPCIDWRHIDYLLDYYRQHSFDFVANNTERSFPDGFDIRIFSVESLDIVNRISSSAADREHVAIYFPNHPEIFSSYNYVAEGEEHRPDLEITLDEEGDYKLIDQIFKALYPQNPDFSCVDVINFLDEHKEVLTYINGIKRTII